MNFILFIITKGWAIVKLRRVYIKEWRDRKNGVDEEEIMERRYQRELEVEQEMILEMSVNGRIRAFEKQIQRNRHNINPKRFQQNFEKLKTGMIYNTVTVGGRKPPRRSSVRRGSGVGGSSRAGSVKRRRSTVRKSINIEEGLKKSHDLSRFIDAANEKLENLTIKVAENITSSDSQQDTSIRSRIAHFNKPPVSPGPRIIAPRAAPVTRTHFTPSSSPDKDKSKSSSSLLLHVETLNITNENFHPDTAYKRPPGWIQLKEKRVAMMEANDKLTLQEDSETDVNTIAANRRKLDQQVCDSNSVCYILF